MKLIFLSSMAAVAALFLGYLGLVLLFDRWRAKRLAARGARVAAPAQELVHTDEVHAFHDTELGYSIDAPQAADLLQELADLRREQLMRSMTPSSVTTTGSNER